MSVRVNVWQWRQRLTPDSVHGHQTATEGNRQDQQGLKPPLGPSYDNQALFPPFGVSDYESLLVKLTEIDVQPHRDDLNKRAFVVWHQLPDELVLKASRSIGGLGIARVRRRSKQQRQQWAHTGQLLRQLQLSGKFILRRNAL